MKKIIFAVSCIALIALVFLIVGLPFPRNYRYTDDKTVIKRMGADQCAQVDWIGIEDLNMSGSAHLKKMHLNWLLRDKNKPVYMFNLTAEDWGTSYINDHHLTEYYGIVEGNGHYVTRKKGPFRQMRYALRQRMNGISDLNKLKLVNEKEMLSEYKHINYFQMAPRTWLSDYTYLDEVIEVFESIPVGSHVYFHCNRGRGRTTTFMAFYDIFRNHKKISFEMALDRQYCLGGKNIGATEAFDKGSWKPAALIERKNLVYYFYSYMNDPQGYGHKKWSVWLEDKGFKADPTLTNYRN